MLRDSLYYDSLLKPLCLIFGRLRSRLKQLFIENIRTLHTTFEFEGIISLFQLYISSHINFFSVTPDESLIGAVKALSILSNANEILNAIDPKLFYNADLSIKLNFKVEYRTWKKSLLADPVTDFSYFNYPFLFDAESKGRIMKIDNLVQMASHYQDAYVNQTFVFKANQLLHDESVVSRSLEEDMKKETNPFLILEIRRNRLITDIIQQLVSKSGVDLKKPLKVRFGIL